MIHARKKWACLAGDDAGRTTAMLTGSFALRPRLKIDALVRLYQARPCFPVQAITAAPVPVDLYTWASHKAYTAVRTRKSQFVPWIALQRQFGADYKRARDFEIKAMAALKKIQVVYPGLKLQYAPGGVEVLASSRPAVPSEIGPGK